MVVVITVSQFSDVSSFDENRLIVSFVTTYSTTVGSNQLNKKHVAG